MGGSTGAEKARYQNPAALDKLDKLDTFFALPATVADGNAQALAKVPTRRFSWC